MKFKNSLIAAAAVLMLAPAAMAMIGQDKAMDKHGQMISDKNGNCVYTKWMVDHDACAMLSVSRAARTVYFDFNRATLKSAEKTKLDSLIRTIRSSKAVSSVDIFGHADKIGSNSYNKHLSRKRAEAVKAYLAKKGGIKTRYLDVKALGSSQPVTSCDAGMSRSQLISCLAEDRRVEIELNVAR